MNRRAFTLVELLVVIGIIAVLISILIPALSAAKRQANTVKCQTQLREIYNCFKLYETEYRGFWPVARINGLRNGNLVTTYKFDDFVFNTTTQGYWFNFLAKFATKARMGNLSGTSAFEGALSRQTIFFGCPNWDGYKFGGVNAGDTNTVQPGYGMNPYPSFTATYPATSIAFPPSVAANRPKEYAVSDVNDNPSGNFLKAIEWTRPSERMLVADSKFWLAQSGKPPVAASYPPAVVAQSQVSNDSTGFGSATQTLVDIYRHGKTPRLIGTAFDPTGGKIAYNVLYADGHVATATDGKEAYRSFRMKFP